MEFDTDVLIVGSGPTGLMLACQLARFGVSFRIIDRQKNRSQESRAVGIQAKSMEIFQNLGIVSDFLKQAIVGTKASFYFGGKLRFSLDFSDVDIKGTSFPNIYFLPQSDTEQILLDHLAQLHIHVERQTELTAFTQANGVIEADINNHLTGKKDKIRCRYIIGCDGAHSVVRQVLGFPFKGASYKQEFVLADLSVTWPIAKGNLTAFMGKKGIFLYIPLQKNYSRLMIAGMGKSQNKSAVPPSLEEIQRFGREITHTNLELNNPIWISRFYLHHRAVKQYMQENAFIAGDAAHIHSPVGGQGMNTGLQDVTNLAWKIAFVLKYGSPKELLNTYQTERQRVGEVLLKTTDRIFGFLTRNDFFTSMLRYYVAPVFMKLLTKSSKFNKSFFHFMSQLGIHYHENPFVIAKTENADAEFLSAPQAGCRAPDAPVGDSTLFELFRKKPCTILIFQSQRQQNPEQENKILDLKKIHPDIIDIHQLIKSPENEVLFMRYGINSAGVYFVRPDGYIGFRAFGNDLEPLFQYLHKLFGIV